MNLLISESNIEYIVLSEGVIGKSIGGIAGLIKRIKTIWNWIKKWADIVFTTVSVKIRAFFNKYETILKNKRYDNIIIKDYFNYKLNQNDINNSTVVKLLEKISSRIVLGSSDNIKSLENEISKLINVDDLYETMVHKFSGDSITVKFSDIRESILIILKNPSQETKAVFEKATKLHKSIVKAIENFFSNGKNNEEAKKILLKVPMIFQLVNRVFTTIEVRRREQAIKIAKYVIHSGTKIALDAKYKK